MGLDASTEDINIQSVDLRTVIFDLDATMVIYRCPSLIPVHLGSSSTGRARALLSGSAKDGKASSVATCVGLGRRAVVVTDAASVAKVPSILNSVIMLKTNERPDLSKRLPKNTCILSEDPDTAPDGYPVVRLPKDRVGFAAALLDACITVLPDAKKGTPKSQPAPTKKKVPERKKVNQRVGTRRVR